MFSSLKCSACCRPSRRWITFNRFLTIFEVFVPHFYLCCTHCIVTESLLNHPNSVRRGMFRLNAKFDADSLVYSLSHLECDSHTAHMLTQTSTVKTSLFMLSHSSPVSLAGRLHQCHPTVLIILTIQMMANSHLGHETWI